MNISVSFAQSNQSFGVSFGEVISLSEEQIQAVRAEAYEKGMIDGIASLPVYNGEVVDV